MRAVRIHSVGFPYELLFWVELTFCMDERCILFWTKYLSPCDHPGNLTENWFYFMQRKIICIFSKDSNDLKKLIDIANFRKVKYLLDFACTTWIFVANRKWRFRVQCIWNVKWISSEQKILYVQLLYTWQQSNIVLFSFTNLAFYLHNTRFSLTMGMNYSIVSK